MLEEYGYKLARENSLEQLFENNLAKNRVQYNTIDWNPIPMEYSLLTTQGKQYLYK